MANFGNAIMGFFSGGASGGGGGTSTGVNGLNGTTNIGLGGTLSSSVNITATGFDFNIINSNSFSFQSNANNGISLIQSVGNVNTSQVQDTLTSFTSTTFHTASQFYTTYNGNQYGLNLNFTSQIFVLGDYDDINSKFKLIVDDANSLITTTDANGTNGLQIGTGFTNIGQFTGSYTYIGINQGNATIETFDTASTSNGLSLDFVNKVYKFGGFNYNATFLQIDDANLTTTLQTDILVPQGGIVSVASPVGTGVVYLVVTIGGVQYSITCNETNLP